MKNFIKQLNKRRKPDFGMMLSYASILGTTFITVLVFILMHHFARNEMLLPSVNILVGLLILTFVLSLIIFSALGRIFLTPLVRLTNAMKKVAEGDFSIRLECDNRSYGINEAYDSFNTMVEELSRTDTLQSDFINNVSHEFKTPINAIEGYASLLQDTCLSESEQNSYVEKIIFNTRRLSELVANVLLLSRVSNQSTAPKCNLYRLDEQLRQALLMLESKWEAKEIEFDIDLDELEYYGPENLMAHVWTNLIDNAVKFSPRAGTVSLSLKEEGDEAVCIIHNYGCFIPEQDMELIFNRFYQCDTSRQSEGHGLGLTLVKKILSVVKSDIHVSSSRQEGTCFEIRLPLI